MSIKLPPIITIDGPTASGKGTISKIISEKLGWSLLDSGSIYRALAFEMINNDIPINDFDSILKLAINLKIFNNGRDLCTYGLSTNNKIRSEEIGRIASIVASNYKVRQALLDKQRSFLSCPGLVADGRDMGTVVFPYAFLKIFLTADISIRAQRRYDQLINKGNIVNIASIVDSIRDRDERDASRLCSPLLPAPDAHVVDSSTLDIEKTLSIILDLYKYKLGPSCN
ncbi:cytidylate kinase [Candidatus Kinetoplastibacterium blastocrithidii TCC012E]|uniref:Cytidylate kinase n=1 Tax=Candidatus Kinetoplastidibacterium blastocrithidiae TCC012E TaxID=1208922 RepID=M1LBN1_9PROT|nr:(d)CMP kinase [Candidatus Kinetoplastibacterium blastocrithidii]AFZ83730.1 cytidylate kinase [Candidatus Kinetoplastibacterium blastocrithidii (ex Strigomonas culicis)]AGF49853.1 cytidylate kinase [Candidatus Kinetoplastibacterium blastocrithidii TCC012E]